HSAYYILSFTFALFFYFTIFLFFFHCYLPHRYLHSFPTRRSSDLAASSTSSPIRANSSCEGTRRAGSATPRSPHGRPRLPSWRRDRKSTRLNSSHLVISYAVFCLKKKKKKNQHKNSYTHTHQTPTT